MNAILAHIIKGFTFFIPEKSSIEQYYYCDTGTRYSNIIYWLKNTLNCVIINNSNNQYWQYKITSTDLMILYFIICDVIPRHYHQNVG